MKNLIALTFIIVFAGCTTTKVAPQAKAMPTTLEEAVASDFRTPANRARDIYRHPVETLKFFGLQPGMTVIEISPGQGWYSEILAPYVAAQGKFIAAAPPIGDSEYMKKTNAKYMAWLNSHPELQGKVTLATFNPPEPIAPDGTADMVLTFRNVHNWMSKGEAEAAFQSFFKALKPGGTLGVVEHRADAAKKQDPKAKSGYVRESEVIRMAKKAGFKLTEKSEINANAKDTKDHSEGVWTLPPALRLGDKDRDRYLAIGESDRMTLKFTKP